MGNENSYTKEFFDKLFQKLDPSQSYTTRPNLERYIILAAQKYMSTSMDYERNIPAHEVLRELKKAQTYIDKTADTLIKVFASGNYGEEIVDNLHDVIRTQYPALHGMLDQLRSKTNIGVKTSPVRSINLLEPLAEALERTIVAFPSKKASPKSIALYRWLMIVAAQLEPTLGRKLEQSHYYDGEYISKKPISDSELLKFIISPLDPEVTISQLETAIKDTHKERRESPWVDYYPL